MDQLRDSLRSTIGELCCVIYDVLFYSAYCNNVAEIYCTICISHLIRNILDCDRRNIQASATGQQLSSEQETTDVECFYCMARVGDG